MKKKSSFIALIFSIISYAQVPDSTSKWNEYNKRYEYFDNYGNLIGYKKYNNLRNEWEYYSENNPKNIKSRNRKVPNLEYPTLSSSDINYAKSIAEQQANTENYARMAKVHDANLKIVQNRINEIFQEINEMEVDQNLKTKLINGMNSWIEHGNEHFNKLDNYDDVKKTISFYNGAFNDLKENFFYRILSEIEKIKFDIAFDNINEIVANTYSKVKSLNISNEQKRKIFTDLDKYIDNGNKKFIQLNNKEIYIKAHNYYTNAYQFVIDKNLK